MLDPFKVNEPVGMSYALGEKDVLKTKDVLANLGHYKVPDSGSTPWPDTPMFEGLKAFQKDQDLKVDGLMKPGGPTEKALRKSTQRLGIMPGEWDWMHGDTKPKRETRRPFDEREDTARQIDELRDIVLDENKGWKHEAGGRGKKTGKQMREYYAPGPGHGFPLPGRDAGDGRKLSGRTDLTIVSPDGKHFKHYQTVDVDRNGKPTKRELDNAERIRRNLINDRGEVHYIILVPKTWQMPK